MKSLIAKIILATGACFLLVNGLSAQHWLGTTLSNQNVTNSAIVNPATLGAAKNKVFVNVAGFGFNVINDYISWGAPFTIQSYLRGNVDGQYKDSNGAINFQNNWLAQNLNGENKNLYFETEVRGPAAMIRLSKKSAISFGVRSRTAFSFTNVSENLAKFAVNGLDTTTVSSNTQVNIGDNLDNLRLRANALSFQEYSLSFGKQFFEVKNFKIKLGATAKLLMGNAYIYAQGDDIDFTVNGLDSVDIRAADFRYGYSDLNNFQDFSPNSLIPSAGGDFGWDAGAVVEYNPKVGENLRNKSTRYLVKAGISLMDMGSITFKNAVSNKVRLNAPFTFVADSNATAAVQDGPFSDRAIEFGDSIVDAYFTVDRSSRVIYRLPSMLSIQLDYNIFKGFYLGALWFQDIRGVDLDKISINRPSQVTLMPRWESNLVEASLPIILNGDYKVLQVGGFVILGPVFAGSDNLLALITQENFYGVNAYFGIATGIGKNKQKKEKEDKEAMLLFSKDFGIY